MVQTVMLALASMCHLIRSALDHPAVVIPVDPGVPPLAGHPGHGRRAGGPATAVGTLVPATLPPAAAQPDNASPRSVPDGNLA